MKEELTSKINAAISSIMRRRDWAEIGVSCYYDNQEICQEYRVRQEDLEYVLDTFAELFPDLITIKRYLDEQR